MAMRQKTYKGNHSPGGSLLDPKVEDPKHIAWRKEIGTFLRKEKRKGLDP